MAVLQLNLAKVGETATSLAVVGGSARHLNRKGHLRPAELLARIVESDASASEGRSTGLDVPIGFQLGELETGHPLEELNVQLLDR